MEASKELHRTLEQQRAEAAFEAVEEAWRKLKDFREYSSLVKKFPALVMRNGLGAALAFLDSKGKNDRNTPHSLLKKHLEDWLCRKAPHSPYRNAEDKNLVRIMARSSSTAYLAASREALAFLQWLKFLASARDKEE